MKRETGTVVYDDELRIEAYRFEGTRQPFPNHFHEHYVIGFVEDGERCLSCKNKEYSIGKGNIILFNPGDNHACVQSDDGTFDYRGFNISKGIMLDLAEEITGKRELPGFSKNVICDDEITCYLRQLHEMVMNGTSDFGKVHFEVKEEQRRYHKENTIEKRPARRQDNGVAITAYFLCQYGVASPYKSSNKGKNVTHRI